MSHRVRWLCLITLTLALLPGVAQGVVTPVAVLKGPEDQWQAFANETSLAWTSNTVQHPSHFNALVRPVDGGMSRRVNAAGTMGFAGNFDPGTDRLIYEQGTRRDVGIFFYDVSDRRRWKVPGVNSNKDEWQPKVSTAFILFQRSRRVSGKWYTDVLLYDRVTQHTRKLGTWPAGKVIRTGNVEERYATFFVGSNRKSFPYLYDSQTKTRTRIPSRQPYAWGPVVDETNGMVYLAASGIACGANVNIWRLPISLAGPPTKIADLSDGVDVGWVMSLAPNPLSGLDLLFYRIVCSRRQGDVYKAQQVDQVT